MATATNSYTLTVYDDGRVMLSHHLGSKHDSKVTYVLLDLEAAHEFMYKVEQKPHKSPSKVLNLVIANTPPEDDSPCPE